MGKALEKNRLNPRATAGCLWLLPLVKTDGACYFGGFFFLRFLNQPCLRDCQVQRQASKCFLVSGVAGGITIRICVYSLAVAVGCLNVLDQTTCQPVVRFTGLPCSSAYYVPWCLTTVPLASVLARRARPRSGYFQIHQKGTEINHRQCRAPCCPHAAVPHSPLGPMCHPELLDVLCCKHRLSLSEPHHMGASFPLHAAAVFLLHMLSLPQLEAVRGSLIYMLYSGRIEVCKFLALCTLAGP